MPHARSFALALAGASVLFVAHTRGASRLEDFSTDPASSGWQTFGDAGLFAWDATNHDLRVTWDSSQTNSYFYHPLGTVLARDDDFAFEFDLRLSDIATNAKSGPFEIAIGFLNFAEAAATNFERGSGVDAVHGPRDIVEFDYFPAGYYPDYGDVLPSLSPTLVSRDNGFASGFDLLTFTTNDLFHIALSYASSNQTLHTQITRNGAPFGPVSDVSLGTNFTDFRVDTFAVSSYSDYGDIYDSVLAHGTVDNLLITLPPSPVGELNGSRTGGSWQVQFASRTNWLYTLERTADFHSWTAVSTSVPGSGGNLLVQDTNPPPVQAFYRINAQRP